MGEDTKPPKLLFTVNEAASALGLGRTMLYHLMGTGQLRPVHIGRPTRSTSDELDRFVDQLQTNGMEAANRPLGLIACVKLFLRYSLRPLGCHPPS